MWNGQKGRESSLISRTFGKVAVIDRDWFQQLEGKIKMPEHDEFWYVDIIKDTGEGSNRGVLIVQPRCRLEKQETRRLPLNSYDLITSDSGVVYVKPKYPSIYWILGLNLKDVIFKEHKTNAVIVVLNDPPDVEARAQANVIAQGVATSSHT